MGNVKSGAGWPTFVIRLMIPEARRSSTLRSMIARASTGIRALDASRSLSSCSCNIIGSFNRLDRGGTYVDHHVFFCVRNERAGLNHFSFEVADIDDVFTGHEHLRKLGKYEHMWGIGRHLLGSQIYDYWSDPWGRVHEHWSDTDRLNAKNGSNLISAEDGLVSQWGERPPERFLNRVIA